MPSRRALLQQTNQGRSQGWDVELDGRAVAHLDEPLWESMFWVNYRITPTTDDPALAARLLSEEFWRGDGWQQVRFRSRALGEVAPHPFPASRPLVEPARLNMRGLYLTEAAAEREARPAGGLFHRLWRLLRGGR